MNRYQARSRRILSFALCLGFALAPRGHAADRRSNFLALHGGEAATPRAPGGELSVARIPAGDLSAVGSMLDEVAASVDTCIFLSGGASKMSDDAKAQLLALFDAFRILAERDVRFLVGDGGTRAGIMQAAGDARTRTGGAFPLLGISPAPELTPYGGTTEPDPGHSHLIAVDFSPAWMEAQESYGWEPSWGVWGSETETMYQAFARLARGKPSVTLVANGGGITLDEVAQNMAQGRKMIVIQGSGRAADGISALLWGTEPGSEEASKRMEKARKMGVEERRDLFLPFDMREGAEAFADAIEAALAGVMP